MVFSFPPKSRTWEREAEFVSTLCELGMHTVYKCVCVHACVHLSFCMCLCSPNMKTYH